MKIAVDDTRQMKAGHRPPERGQSDDPETEGEDG